jgi:hypothetical protein
MLKPDDPDLKEFDENFLYRRDTLFRFWRVGEEGNCQDFAWSKLVLIAGGKLKAFWMLVTFQAIIWRARSPSNGLFARHAVLWVNDFGYSDSTDRAFRDVPAPSKLRYSILHLWLAIGVFIYWFWF